MIYSKLEIKNYRCFKGVTIDSLQRFNLITGANNIGKTSLLEAAFIMSGTHAELMLRTNTFRWLPFWPIDFSVSGTLESPLNTFFYNFDTGKDIEFSAKKGKNEWRKVIIKASAPSSLLISTAGEDSKTSISGGISQGLGLFQYEDSAKKKFSSTIIMSQTPKGVEVKIDPAPPPVEFMTIFINALEISTRDQTERVGKLLAKGQKRELIEILKIIQPNVEDIMIIPIGNVPVIHLAVGLPKPLPLPLTGLGMVRILRYFGDIMNAPGGVVLIDEIENGLHWLKANDIWRIIKEVARNYDVQIFATTHSMECIRAAYSLFSGDATYDLGVYRLESGDNGVVNTINYDKETLGAALENNLEVR